MSENQLEKMREVCLNLVSNLLPMITESLENRVTNIVRGCASESEVTNLIQEFTRYYDDISKGQIHGPYPILSDIPEGGQSTVYHVKYNGSYKSFREAFMDFIGQIPMRRDELIRVFQISTITFQHFKYNTCPVPLEEFSRHRTNLYEKVRKKVLEHLQVDPPEALQELRNLPIFSEDCKPVRYQRK